MKLLEPHKTIYDLYAARGWKERTLHFHDMDNAMTCYEALAKAGYYVSAELRRDKPSTVTIRTFLYATAR